MMLAVKLALVLVGVADAQMFGTGSKRDPTNGMSQEELEHMQGTPQGAAAVDRAMQVCLWHRHAFMRQRGLTANAPCMDRNGTRSQTIRR